MCFWCEKKKKIILKMEKKTSAILFFELDFILFNIG